MSGRNEPNGVSTDTPRFLNHFPAAEQNLLQLLIRAVPELPGTLAQDWPFLIIDEATWVWERTRHLARPFTIHLCDDFAMRFPRHASLGLEAFQRTWHATAEFLEAL